MVCRFCEKERTLIKAHIIPEGLVKLFPPSAGVTTFYTNTIGAYPKRAPVGVYDTSILCHPCDNRFSPWDQHAQDVLLHGFSKDSVIRHESATIGWLIREFDYRRLKLFFLALLWRASVSTHSFFGRISTGPFEKELRHMLKNSDPGASETFAVVLARFENDAYALATLDPHLERYEGVNYCRFYPGGFIACIKVDQRPSASALSAVALQEGVPVVVVARDAKTSKDANVMRDIARRAVRFQYGS